MLNILNYSGDLRNITIKSVILGDTGEVLIVFWCESDTVILRHQDGQIENIFVSMEEFLSAISSGEYSVARVEASLSYDSNCPPTLS